MTTSNFVRRQNERGVSMDPVYRRVLIKLSGEALGVDGKLFDFNMFGRIAEVIARISRRGVQVALVLGGGNLWRGREAEKTASEMDRVLADHMGMLGTVMNSLAMRDALLQNRQKARVFSAIPITGMVEPYFYLDALRCLQQNEVAILACGLGTSGPFHSTDTAAAQRAAEIKADAILMAKNVDGIYDSDPKENKAAKIIESATYRQMIRQQMEQGKEAIDTEALILCQKTELPAMLVFALQNPDDMERMIDGEKPGTLLTPEM